MKEKAVGYIRVSTEKQQEKYSPEAQRRENKECAEANNLQIVKFFEEAKSGYKLKARTEFYRMLEYISEKKIEHIVALLPNRLTRNMQDYIELVDASDNLTLHFARGKSVPISDPDAFREIYHLETDFAKAKEESAERSFIVRNANIEKRERGGYTSKAPLGYWHNPYTKKIELDYGNNRANFVRQAFELYSTGDYSLNSLVKKMRNLGLTTREENPVPKSTMGKNLRKRFYYGEFFIKSQKYPEGKIYSNKGTYAPLISKALWEKVQEELNKKKTTKKNTKDFTYRGILECVHCGCMITAEIKKGITYYHCTNGRNTSYYQEKFKSDNCPKKGMNWREEEIEYAFTHVIGELHFDKGILSWLRKKLYEDDDNRKVFIDAELDRLSTEYTMNDKEMEGIFDYAFKNKIPGDIVTKKIDKIKNRQQEVREEKTALEEEKEEYIKNALQTLELMEDFKNQYLTADSQKRKQMHKLMFRTVLAGDNVHVDDMGIIVSRKTWRKGKIDNRNNLAFTWNEPFRTLFDIKFIQEISEYDANIDKKDESHARRDSNSRPAA